MQARLSLRWPHVREVTSHELIRFVKHGKNTLVCASVRTCDDPLESFNVFNLLPHNTVSLACADPESFARQRFFI